MLKTLILSAAAAGLAAGLVTAALQQATTTPIIIAAERYESGAVPNHGHGGDQHAVVGTHDGVHAEAAWAPADGLQRTLSTSLATVVMGFGFGLALLGAMLLTGAPVEGRSGLAFGAAGFAAVALAPALGLPPELPGNAAADLGERQLWWAATVMASGAGLGALLLARKLVARLAGIVLLALPHIVGAPQPDAFKSAAPAELAGQFAAASLVVSAVFWALLGFAAGAVYRRLEAGGPHLQ